MANNSRNNYYASKVRAGLFWHDATQTKRIYLRVWWKTDPRYEQSGPLCCTVLPMSALPKVEPVGICPINAKAREILKKKREKGKNASPSANTVDR